MKYYTPKITEFHVCFECEFKSYDNDGKGNFIERWDKRIIGLHTFQESSYEQITYNSNWRVKYLDKQDIEEVLKVKQKGKSQKELKFILNKDKILQYEFNYYPESNKLEILLCSIIKKPYDDSDDTIFCGKIKNKNEFKKLLTHLEIVI